MTERPRFEEQTPFPTKIKPMIPAKTDRLPSHLKDWLCEVKWNGIRATIYINGENVTIRSKAGREVTESFPELKDSLAALGQNHKVVLDGEIVCDQGKTRQDLELVLTRLKSGERHARKLAASLPCQFVAFDILHLNGRDLTQIPLQRRKEILSQLLSPVKLKLVYTNRFIRRNFGTFIEGLKLGDYEGAIFKARNSIYRPGIKSPSWLKMKFG